MKGMLLKIIWEKSEIIEISFWCSIGRSIYGLQSNDKKLMNKMLLTQSEFVEELGVSIASIARWETGENEPTMKVKRKLQVLFEKYNIEVIENYDD